MSAALGLTAAAAAALVLKEDLCVPFYLWQLDSKNEVDRLSAAERLGKVRSGWAVPRLVALLQAQRSLTPQARIYGEALAKIGPRAVPALLEAMPVEKGPSNEAIASVLWPIAQRAIPRVGQCLGHQDPVVRRFAAKVLGSLDPPEPEAVPFLLRALADPDGEVCCEAALNLQWLDLDADAIMPIARMLRRNDQYAISLEAAARALAKIGGAAFPVLVDALKDASAKVRAAAAASLGHFRSPLREKAVPILVTALKDEDSGVKSAAAYSLGLLGGKARVALPALIELLRDADQKVLAAVLIALAKIGPGEEAVPALARLLCRERQPASDVECTVTVLALMGPAARASVPVLIEALKDPRASCRGFSAMALGRIGTAPHVAVPALIDALKDQEDSCKCEAMEALGRFGPGAKEAVPALIGLLASDQLISQAATESLVSIGADAVRPLAEALRSEDGERRRSAAEALGAFGALGKAALPELTAALSDQDPNVVLRAIRSVGAIGAAAQPAIPALMKIFRREDSYWEPRSLVAEALGKIGPGAAEAVPLLLEALGDEEEYVRGHAALALGRIGTGGAKALPLIRALLEDEGGLVRCFAALSILDYLGKDAEASRTLISTFHDPLFNERDYVLGRLKGYPSEARALLEYLIEALKENDTSSPLTALSLLAAIGREAGGALPAIRKVLAERVAEGQSGLEPFALLRTDAVEEAARKALRSIEGGEGKESR